ncbi:guanylin-like [Dendropsophus ebraccatus]|uniref:guanylin-like n=1 Tax=Dendropsophus ebraccatus TaxID=150705 RepID=UPI0038317C37
MAVAPRENQRSPNMWTRVLCLLALVHISAEVTVKVGDFTFPLETVKKLKEIVEDTELGDNHVQRDEMTSYQEMCSALPGLRDLCATQRPGLIIETLRGLERVAEDLDECEICAFAACSGC